MSFSDRFNLLSDDVFDPPSTTAQGPAYNDDAADLLEPFPLLARSGHKTEELLRDFMEMALQQVERDEQCSITSSSKRCADIDLLPGAKRSRFDGDFNESTTAMGMVNHNNDSDELISRFRPHHQQQWDTQFLALLEFKQAWGHCCVPHAHAENPVLSRWVKRQRYQYKLRHEGKSSTRSHSAPKQCWFRLGFSWCRLGRTIA